MIVLYKFCPICQPVSDCWWPSREGKIEVPTNNLPVEYSKITQRAWTIIDSPGRLRPIISCLIHRFQVENIPSPKLTWLSLMAHFVPWFPNKTSLLDFSHFGSVYRIEIAIFHNHHPNRWRIWNMRNRHVIVMITFRWNFGKITKNHRSTGPWQWSASSWTMKKVPSRWSRLAEAKSSHFTKSPWRVVAILKWWSHGEIHHDPSGFGGWFIGPRDIGHVWYVWCLGTFNNIYSSTVQAADVT